VQGAPDQPSILSGNVNANDNALAEVIPFRAIIEVAPAYAEAA